MSELQHERAVELEDENFDLRAQLTAALAQVEEQKRAVEWRDSIVGLIKILRAKPGFDHEWTGDKDGWGYCFEWIKWVQARAIQAESDLALLRGQREADRGIYVASRVKHADMWKSYRREGCPIISTWIDEAGDGDTEDFGELWARIESEIRRCEFLVFYAAGPDDFPFKGALIETGMALAMDKPVRVVLQNVELKDRTMRPIGSWILDRRVIRMESLDAALATGRGAG